MVSKLKPFLLRSLQSLELWTFLVLALTSWQSSSAILKYANEPDVWDEPSIYLQQGLQIAKNIGKLFGFFAIEGPLYSSWYAFLSHFESDPFQLYYLNGRLLAFLIPLAFYLSCRAMRFSQLGSVLAAISLMLFPPLLTINRWNNHFLLLVLLVGFALIARIQEQLRFAAAFVILNVVAAFVRPELQVGVFISIGYLGYLLARDFNWKKKRELIPVGAALISFGFLAMTFWFNGPRSFNKDKFVFFDYTARRYSEWQNLPWIDVVTKLYGPNVESPIQAFIANPVEMMKHVAFYSSLGLSTLFSMLGSFGYLFQTSFGLILLVVLVGIAIASFVLHKTSQKSVLRTKLFGEESALPPRFVFLAASTVLPVVAVICLYGSVPRYFLALVVALLAFIFSFVRREGKPIAFFVTAVVCLLCFLVPVDYGVNAFAQKFYGPDNYSQYGQVRQRSTVLAFRAIRLREPRVTITVNFPGQVFVDGINQAIRCWDPSAPCSGFDDAGRSDLREVLNDLKVNEILYDYDLRMLLEGRLKNPGLKADLLRFFDHPDEFDFARVTVPCTQNVIFVRKSSLHPELPPEHIESSIANAVLKDLKCPRT